MLPKTLLDPVDFNPAFPDYLNDLQLRHLPVIFRRLTERLAHKVEHNQRSWHSSLTIPHRLALHLFAQRPDNNCPDKRREQHRPTQAAHRGGAICLPGTCQKRTDQRGDHFRYHGRCAVLHFAFDYCGQIPNGNWRNISAHLVPTGNL